MIYFHIKYIVRRLQKHPGGLYIVDDVQKMKSIEAADNEK